MPFTLDLSRRIQEVLGEAEVKSAMADTAAGIDNAYISRHVHDREAEIEGQLAKHVQLFATLESQLDTRRTQLAALTADRWHSVTTQALPGFALIGGFILFIAWATGADVRGWAIAAFDFRTFSIVNVATMTVLVLVAFTLAAQINWIVRIKPRNRQAAEDDALLAKALGETQTMGTILDRQATELVRRNVFEVINSGKAPFFQRTLFFDGLSRKRRRITSGGGLSEVANKYHEAPTTMRREIVDLLESLPGASIGISGSRGAGKTTLLRSLCGANFPLRGKQAIAIYTAAPVEYEPRDFLLHLFITLCRQVITTHSPGYQEEESLRHFRSPTGANVLRSFLSDRAAGGILTTIGIAAAFLATAIAGIQFSAEQVVSAVPKGKSVPLDALFIKSFNLSAGPLLIFGLGLVAVGGVILLASLQASEATQFTRIGLIFRSLSNSITGRVRKILAEAPKTPEEDLAETSIARLHNLKFQRTFTTGWSGAFKAPIGMEMSLSGSNAIAQRQESYPELVQSFRDYVSEIVAIHGHVVIAIDELDKMKTAENAETFVNEIKSIFNIPRCFFLVSVSEDALSGFERRGLALRDAFDSAFDDIRYLGHLDLDGSRRLLFRRFLNLPDNFLCLCHMLSGGLPRDLIRLARAMLVAAQQEGGDLTKVSLTLARNEAAAKIRASKIAARALGMAPGAVAFQVALATLERRQIGPQGFGMRLRQLEELSLEDLTPEGRRLATIRNELVAYLRFLETAISLTADMQKEEGWKLMTGKGYVEQVAQIRQGLEASAAVGLARLRTVRSDLRLPPIPAHVEIHQRESAIFPSS